MYVEKSWTFSVHPMKNVCLFLFTISGMHKKQLNRSVGIRSVRRLVTKKSISEMLRFSEVEMGRGLPETVTIVERF